MPADPIPTDRLTRFTGRGAIYARSRPTYPREALDALLEGLGAPDALVGADVGAGTGISARLLAERGLRVIALEPNDDMRAAAAAHPRVAWRAALGERTGLDDAGVDVVLCAQSFHWMEPEPALAEFARVIRRGGRLGLMWNSIDRSTPIGRAYDDIIRRHATSTVTSPGRTRAHESTLPILGGAPGFAGARHATFRHAQRLALAPFTERFASSSYCPRSGYAFEAMSGAIAQAFDDHASAHDGDRSVELVYVTHLFLADRAP